MKKKFKIIDACSGEKIKLKEGEMIVMNSQGIFFLISGMKEGWQDPYTHIVKLSDVCPRFEVIWKGEE